MTFIGGLNDGKNADVPDDLLIVRLPVPKEHQCQGCKMEIEEYRKESIGTRNEYGYIVHSFYVSQTISTATAISMLLKNYKRP